MKLVFHLPILQVYVTGMVQVHVCVYTCKGESKRPFDIDYDAR